MVAGGLSMMIEPGGVVSTDQVRIAGVASVLPATSVARTRNSCAPAASPVYCLGELHAVNAAPSSEHSKLAPASSAENPKVAEVLGARRARTGVDGRLRRRPVVVSRCRSRATASTLPAPSTARTESVCCPVVSAAGA